MRNALGVFGLVLVACVQTARADVNPNAAAPADEYFGPYKQSVLEIRNRLNDYDRLTSQAMLDPSVGGYLDHLQLAIRDWQHQYPRDPWLPPAFAHLVREYWRAGQASGPTGVAALALMRVSYPDSIYTAQTVALVDGSNAELDAIAQDGAADTASDDAAPAAMPSYATQTVPSSEVADDAPTPPPAW
jgi:hypothetical protein